MRRELEVARVGRDNVELGWGSQSARELKPIIRRMGCTDREAENLSQHAEHNRGKILGTALGQSVWPQTQEQNCKQKDLAKGC